MYWYWCAAVVLRIRDAVISMHILNAEIFSEKKATKMRTDSRRRDRLISFLLVFFPRVFSLIEGNWKLMKIPDWASQNAKPSQIWPNILSHQILTAPESLALQSNHTQLAPFLNNILYKWLDLWVFCCKQPQLILHLNLVMTKCSLRMTAL